MRTSVIRKDIKDILFRSKQRILVLVVVPRDQFPMPTDPGAVRKIMNESLSFVIVRHPLDRVVSVYYQKLIDLGKCKMIKSGRRITISTNFLLSASWKRVNDWIKRDHRKGNLEPNKTMYEYIEEDPYYARWGFVANLR